MSLSSTFKKAVLFVLGGIISLTCTNTLMAKEDYREIEIDERTCTAKENINTDGISDPSIVYDFNLETVLVRQGRGGGVLSFSQLTARGKEKIEKIRKKMPANCQ